MIYKGERVGYKDWSYQNNIPISKMLEDVKIYWIDGGYFYHSKVEAFGFDREEIEELYKNEYAGRKTTDVYNYSSGYSLEEATLGELLKRNNKRICEEEKKRIITAFDKLIDFLNNENNENK